MKRFIFSFLLIFGLLSASSLNAQVLRFKTYQFSIKYKKNDVWGDWSDWQPSDLRVLIDLDEDMITVKSEKIQVYQVLEHDSSYTDKSGGKQLKYYVKDQDGDKGYVRLRVETNNNIQLYVDFNDVMWVYNMKEIEE